MSVTYSFGGTLTAIALAYTKKDKSLMKTRFQSIKARQKEPMLAHKLHATPTLQGSVNLYKHNTVYTADRALTPNYHLPPLQHKQHVHVPIGN